VSNQVRKVCNRARGGFIGKTVLFQRFLVKPAPTKPRPRAKSEPDMISKAIIAILNHSCRYV